ncbi:MAG: aminopeptidase [Alicyclobacillaceae bacterium]|nr:aminopeptidase [Alicyclobacillaceae bacterium]
MPSREKLEQYAEVLVNVGLNVQKGQPVHIGAPLEAADFVHILAEKAYDAGAYQVDIDWHSPVIRHLRMDRESMDALSDVPAWTVRKQEELCEKNTAFLVVDAEDPDLLADISPERIAVHARAWGTAFKEANRNFMEDRVSWLVCSIPTVSWAKKMFPELSETDALQKLWDAIFHVMRMDQDDPVGAWHNHLDALERRSQFMNSHHFKKLHYTAPGTDLTIELPELHTWLAARSINEKGTSFVANMPTEEVFTLPKKDGVQGVVRSTMPLAYNGTVIEGIELTFERGRITKYHATSGLETLKELIESDDGSHYLGEVALVPHESPISNLNQLFYSTLFDENASCHLAIGKAYPTCLVGGRDMTEEEQVANGANDSITHIDFMIGSAELDIDGTLEDGSDIAIFRKGNWVI